MGSTADRRRRLDTGSRIFGVVAGATLLAGVGGAEPPALVEPDGWASEAEVVRFAGGEPEQCVHAAKDRKLCSWWIRGRFVRGDQPDSRATSEGANLICQLPFRAEDGTRGPCRAHPRQLQTATPSSLPPVGTPGGIDPAATALEPARRVLDGARTVTELSHLVGALPHTCRSVLQNPRQTCEWLLIEGSPGHRRLVALAGSEGLATLRCSIPLDGSDRGPDSCKVASVD